MYDGLNRPWGPEAHFVKRKKGKGHTHDEVCHFFLDLGDFSPSQAIILTCVVQIFISLRKYESCVMDAGLE